MYVLAPKNSKRLLFSMIYKIVIQLLNSDLMIFCRIKILAFKCVNFTLKSEMATTVLEGM